MNRPDASQIALNGATSENAPTIGEALALALNAEGAPCEWLMLVPAGNPVRGSDGRAFKNPDPKAVVDAFAREGRAAPIDINHAQFLKAPMGEESPAAGWIEELQLREGAIWGRVEWTAIGLNALREKTYRYISPALVTPRDTIVSLAGAGLVNRPNFNMPALNAAEETSMNKELLKKLGLAENATENDVLAAIEALQTQLNAAKGAAPSLSLYVPRGDYDLVVRQRDEAQTALNARDEGDRKAKGEALVEQAVKDGKIAPATKDFYLKLCATEAGLKEVQDFVSKQPSKFVAVNFNENANRSEGGGDRVELNADETRLCAQMGLTAEQFLKSRADLAARRAQ